MKDRFTELDPEEQSRWSAWALEWVSNENARFGEFVKQLSTYVLVGNTAGFATLVGLIKDSPLILLKISVCSFSLGLLSGILAGLLLMLSQWRCLDDYRQRIIDFYNGIISIDEFNKTPDYYKWRIGSFLALSIICFAVGGGAFVWWITFYVDSRQ